MDTPKVISDDSRTASANKPAHTPGPWIVDQDYRPGMSWNRHIATEAEPFFTICFMCHSNGVDEACDEANANLVAAAPDLLSVLRDLEWIGMNDGRGVTHLMCPACSALKSRGSGHNHYCGLAAAIAKAEAQS